MSLTFLSIYTIITFIGLSFAIRHRFLTRDAQENTALINHWMDYKFHYPYAQKLIHSESSGSLLRFHSIINIKRKRESIYDGLEKRPSIDLIRFFQSSNDEPLYYENHSSGQGRIFCTEQWLKQQVMTQIDRYMLNGFSWLVKLLQKAYKAKDKLAADLSIDQFFSLKRSKSQQIYSTVFSKYLVPEITQSVSLIQSAILMTVLKFQIPFMVSHLKTQYYCQQGHHMADMSKSLSTQTSFERLKSTLEVQLLEIRRLDDDFKDAMSFAKFVDTYELKVRYALKRNRYHRNQLTCFVLECLARAYIMTFIKSEYLSMYKQTIPFHILGYPKNYRTIHQIDSKALLAIFFETKVTDKYKTKSF